MKQKEKKELQNQIKFLNKCLKWEEWANASLRSKLNQLEQKEVKRMAVELLKQPGKAKQICAKRNRIRNKK